MTVAAVLDRVPREVMDDLKARYAEPQRSYHVWHHIEALLRWAEDLQPTLVDVDAVILAILFHDAVYDPMRSDNESESARLLERASLDAFSDVSRARAVRMVEATARHEVPIDVAPSDRDDLVRFLDMDLSILGASEAVFDRYEAAVREEYAFVPEPLFRAGRRKILQGFLEPPALYFSDWGRDRFEVAARANLARSIAALT
jgi:predicted metal-dependent HD superfamily phosphohydrolase